MDPETDLEGQLERRLLIVSCDKNSLLTIEENPFSAWELTGVARFLEMYAEAVMVEEENEEEDG